MMISRLKLIIFAASFATSIAPINATPEPIFDRLTGVELDRYLLAQVYVRPENTTAYLGIAMAFTVPEGQFRLDSIDVPIYRYEGIEALTLSLYSDVNGLPGAPIVDFASDSPWPSYYDQPVITSLQPTSDILISGSSTYWVVTEIESNGEDSVYYWSTVKEGRTTETAWNINAISPEPSDSWELTTNPPDLALRVFATAVPEASTLGLLALASALIFLAVRTKRNSA